MTGRDSFLQGECLRLAISFKVQSNDSMSRIELRHYSAVLGALFLWDFPSLFKSF